MVGVKNSSSKKIDLVEYSEEVYSSIVSDYTKFADEALNIDEITAIPISALKGDNIVGLAKYTMVHRPFGYGIPRIVEVSSVSQSRQFRLPVQWVNRPNREFRGFAGLIGWDIFRLVNESESSQVEKNQLLKKLLLMMEITDGAGRSVTLTPEDEIDISRGDVITKAENPCSIADQFQTRILWMDDSGMMPGREYLFKSNTQSTNMTLGS